MSLLNTFDINFVGLKNGQHEFTYQLDSSFFELFDYSPVKKGILDVKLLFDKKDTFFTLEFEISGTVELICDRCLDPFDFSFKIVEQQLVKIEEKASEEEEEWIVLSKNDYQLNVAALIYEFSLLSLPLINLHPDKDDNTSGCNPETISILNKLSGNTSTAQTDPRWDALKKINPN